MSSYELIRVERDGHIGALILNRPEKLNSLSTPMLEEFDQALAELGEDEDVRVVVIKGAGRSFSAGYDLGPDDPMRLNRTTTSDRENQQHKVERWLKIWDLAKPVIAQVHGHCLAGATQMCVASDITVVAEDARIGFPALPLGGGMISPTWLWLVGPKRAKELSFTPGSWISGKEAAEWGWANRAVPAAELDETVLKMARKIAKVHPEVLRIKKLANNRVMELQGFRTAFTFGAEWDAILHFAPSVVELQTRIREQGLKAAIAHYNVE
jgi:enoyl-CoA hydratase